jgi:hypothetical protein
METTYTPPPLWTQLVPLFVITIPFLVLMIFLAGRKGRNVAVYILLGLIPVVNFVAALWLASQTDASVKAELEELRRRLDAKI